jgi:hypothetical protein
VPNIFYAFDEDSKRMKVRTMEDSYPKLSQLDDDRHQYFTFRFTNASEIVYDPDILQMLRSSLSSWFFKNSSPEAKEEPPKPPPPPIFQKSFTLKETFIRYQWEMVCSEIGSWATNVLRAVSGDVTGIIDTVTTLLNAAGHSNTSSSKEMQLVEWQASNRGDEHFPCLVAIKSEGQETVKKVGLKKVIGRTSSSKSASAQVYCIQAGNEVAYQELIGLTRSNFVSIANYFSLTFEQERVVAEITTNERRGNADDEGGR